MESRRIDGAKEFAKLEDMGLWPANRRPKEAGTREDTRRFLTGGPCNDVILTIIRQEFSRGPWTSAVQGENNFKYILR